MFSIEKLADDGNWYIFNTYINQTASEVAFNRLKKIMPTWSIRLIESTTLQERIPAKLDKTGIAQREDAK